MQGVQLSPDLWPACRSWLLPYDGSASELFILDLATACATAVADCVETRCRLIRRGEDADPESLQLDVSLSRLANAEVAHIAAVASYFGRPVQLYFDRRSEGRFDLEIVFWSDIMFPESASESEREQTFHDLVQFAMEICAQGDGRAVLIGPEWNGDPRPFESSPANVIWRRG